MTKLKTTLAAALLLAAPAHLHIVGAHPVRTRATVALTLASDQHVAVDVFDVMGRHVARLYEGGWIAGEPRQIEWQTAGVAPGLYVVRVTGERATAQQRVMVAR